MALKNTGESNQPSNLGFSDVIGLVDQLSRRISMAQIAAEIGLSTDELVSRQSRQTEYSPGEIARLFRTINTYGFSDLLPPHGVQPVPYNLKAPFELLAPPLGYEIDPPVLPLISRETRIAGFRVDFPLGLPASVLAGNAKWIEFYARRGFDILTYKTVRSVYRQEHPWPNWVFIENPQRMVATNPVNVLGKVGFWPDDLSTASMANSFGVPSLEPGWWMEDVQRARSIVREGHQVLIVSIVASFNDTLDAMVNDFIAVAQMAKSAGADIIEANYSCPNTPGDPAGEVYKSPETSSKISSALRQALGGTKLFVKIGYLPAPTLERFVALNAKYINGIVAINTISAQVKNNDGRETFPGRPSAGVSGWAIKESSREVSKNLVSLRDRFKGNDGRPITLLGVGGIATPQDVFDHLDIGVDGVETCTGAFVNPHIALQTRCPHPVVNKSNNVGLTIKAMGAIFVDTIKRPTRHSVLRIDRNTGQAVVDPALQSGKQIGS